MQIGFAGSPNFAANILSSLVQSGRAPSIVLTQPPRQSGRRRAVVRTPVHELAACNELEVATPVRLKGHEHLFRQLDLLVVAAYGLILPRSVIDTPRKDCINVHASLLPRWRGASPIEHAILHGDAVTGVSIMRILPKLDAGPVYKTLTYDMRGDETTESLTQSLSQRGTQALSEVLEDFEKGLIEEPTPQEPSRVTYAPRLTSSDAKIQWENSASFLERHLRAFVGRNPAFTNCGDVRIRILQASLAEGEYIPGQIYRSGNNVVVGCAENGLKLDRVQLNRGKGTPIRIEDAVNGYAEIFCDGGRFA